MPTAEEITKFFQKMDKDMSETRQLVESEEMLMRAVERYEKAWGVKIKKPLDTE